MRESGQLLGFSGQRIRAGNTAAIRCEANGKGIENKEKRMHFGKTVIELPTKSQGEGFRENPPPERRPA